VNVAAVSSNAYPLSVAAAKQLLTSNGWKVVPGGTTTCVKPGTGAGECGAGISAGEGISFNLDYQSGVNAVQNEMNDLAAEAKKVGIDINLTNHPFATVISTATACKPSQNICKWAAENWGAGWIYGPSYLPTGEQLFQAGAVANYGSYSDPTTTKLIAQTITGPAAQETQALTAYAENIKRMLPVVFGPTSIGTFSANAGTLVAKNLGGYTANALGILTPEEWYLTK
jgi:peptide/nickel transport system substrate-binding protein